MGVRAKVVTALLLGVFALPGSATASYKPDPRAVRGTVGYTNGWIVYQVPSAFGQRDTIRALNPLTMNSTAVFRAPSPEYGVRAMSVAGSMVVFSMGREFNPPARGRPVRRFESAVYSVQIGVPQVRMVARRFAVYGSKRSCGGSIMNAVGTLDGRVLVQREDWGRVGASNKSCARSASRKLIPQLVEYSPNGEIARTMRVPRTNSPNGTPLHRNTTTAPDGSGHAWIDNGVITHLSFPTGSATRLMAPTGFTYVDVLLGPDSRLVASAVSKGDPDAGAEYLYRSPTDPTPVLLTRLNRRTIRSHFCGNRLITVELPTAAYVLYDGAGNRTGEFYRPPVDRRSWMIGCDAASAAFFLRAPGKEPNTYSVVQLPPESTR